MGDGHQPEEDKVLESTWCNTEAWREGAQMLLQGAWFSCLQGNYGNRGGNPPSCRAELGSEPRSRQSAGSPIRGFPPASQGWVSSPKSPGLNAQQMCGQQELAALWQHWMEQFPSSPHFFIFPLGECCVRANVRILAAFLGTRDVLCYKKTFKKDSTFSARHAALSNSWQGLANTPTRTHSSAINNVVPTN